MRALLARRGIALAVTTIFFALNSFFPELLYAETKGQYREQLSDAILSDDGKKVAALIKKGADLDAEADDGSIALCQAIRKNNPDITRMLLDAGADPARGERDGTTALMVAARLGDEADLELLIGRRAALNAQNDVGFTALMEAVNADAIDSARALCEAGADLELREKSGGYTALFLARYNPAILRVLLEYGADASVKSDDGCDLIQGIPIESLSDPILLALLFDRGASPNGKNSGGEPILLKAAENLNPTLLKALITRGADASLTDAAGNTALHALAGSYGDDAAFADVLGLLNRAGVNPAQRNGAGELPLDAVSESGSFQRTRAVLKITPLPARGTEKRRSILNAALASLIAHGGYDQDEETCIQTVDEFLAAGADADARGNEEDPLIILALDGSYRDALVPLLLDRGASPATCDHDGRTLLSLAAENSKIEIVRKILDAGANVDQRNADGMTPLMCSRSSDAVAMLLDAGADIEARDAEGQTAAHHFAARWDDECITAILTGGADPFAPALDGSTPVQKAISFGCGRTAEVLLLAGADPRGRYENGANALLAWLRSSKEYESRDTRRIIAQRLLDAGIRADEKDSAGESPLSLLLKEESYDRDEELLAILKKATPVSSVSAINEEIKAEARNQALAEAPDKIKENLAFIAIPMLLIGLSIGMREGLYRDRPAENWMGTVNSMIGMGALCGITLGGIGMLIVNDPSATGWQGFGNGLAVAATGIGGACLGGLAGAGLGLIPKIRETVTRENALYYLPSAAAGLFSLIVTVSIWTD